MYAVGHGAVRRRRLGRYRALAEAPAGVAVVARVVSGSALRGVRVVADHPGRIRDVSETAVLLSANLDD